MMPLRILIADDHELFRKGLRRILESNPDFEVCGEASSGLEAIAKTGELKPDLLILDLTMPTMDGFEATRKIRALYPGTPILILSMHSVNEFMTILERIGTSGYVRKSDSPEILMNAITAIAVKSKTRSV